jgi:hypothetical protein
MHPRTPRPELSDVTADDHRERRPHGQPRWSRARPRFLRTLRVVLVPTVLVVGCTGQVAHASFSTAASASATYSSSTLQPPSNVSATCLRGGPGGGGPDSTATVTWTATTSPYATGYRISWTGGSTTAASSPATINGMTKNVDFTFTVQATYRNWTSTGVTSGVANC